VLLGILTPQHCSWERDCDLGASRIFAICKDSTRILSVLSPCPRLGKQGGEWVWVSRVLIPIDRNSNRSVIRDPVAAFNEVFNMHCQCQRDFFVFFRLILLRNNLLRFLKLAFLQFEFEAFGRV